MRTFLRVSLLGNAFLDLACILLLLSHGRGNQPRAAAPYLELAAEQVPLGSNNAIGIFAVEAPFVQSELPESFPAGLWDGNTMLAELVQLDGIPKYITAYEVGWLNRRFESKPFDLRLGGRAYSGLSP